MSARSTTLRRMLDGPEIVVLPGAYDALSARLAERAGFSAMFTTGFGFSASVLGQPDFGGAGIDVHTSQRDARKALCTSRGPGPNRDGHPLQGDGVQALHLLAGEERDTL